MLNLFRNFSAVYFKKPALCKWAISVVVNSVLFWYPKFEHKPTALEGAQGQMSTVQYRKALRTQLQPQFLVWCNSFSSTVDIRGGK